MSAISFYSRLFESKGRPIARHFNFEDSKMTDANNAMLLALPSMTKLKVVVFSTDINSAPGRDGFGVGFYQSSKKICYGQSKTFIGEWASPSIGPVLF